MSRFLGKGLEGIERAFVGAAPAPHPQKPLAGIGTDDDAEETHISHLDPDAEDSAHHCSFNGDEPRGLDRLVELRLDEHLRLRQGVDHVAAFPGRVGVDADERGAVRPRAEVGGQDLLGPPGHRSRPVAAGSRSCTSPGYLVRPEPSRAWNLKSRDIGGSFTEKYAPSASTGASYLSAWNSSGWSSGTRRSTPTWSSWNWPVTLNRTVTSEPVGQTSGVMFSSWIERGISTSRSAWRLTRMVASAGLTANERAPDQEHRRGDGRRPAEPAIIDQRQHVVPRCDLAGLAGHLADQHPRHAARVRLAAG